MLRKSEVIILHLIPYGEADRVVHAVSNDMGMIHAFAKGVRKLKSRIGGKLDLLNFGELHYFDKGLSKLAVINDFDLLNSFITLKKDTDRLFHAMVMSELTASVSGRGVANRHLFKILLAFLKALDKRHSDPMTLLILFEMYLINAEGYSPVAKRRCCEQCGGTLVFPLQWRFRTSTLLCARCAGHSEEHGQEQISERLSILFQEMAFPDVNKLSQAKFEPEFKAYAQAFCYGYLKYYISLSDSVIRAYSMLNLN